MIPHCYLFLLCAVCTLQFNLVTAFYIRYHLCISQWRIFIQIAFSDHQLVLYYTQLCVCAFFSICFFDFQWIYSEGFNCQALSWIEIAWKKSIGKHMCTELFHNKSRVTAEQNYCLSFPFSPLLCHSSPFHLFYTTIEASHHNFITLLLTNKCEWKWNTFRWCTSVIKW